MEKKKRVKINEGQLKEIIKDSIKTVLEESDALALNYYDNYATSANYGEIDEMARINVNEPSGSIFPYQKYDVHIWSNDHEPAHFHIITTDWDVEFYISDGSLYKIKKEGKDKKILKYITEKAPEWLKQPCSILPSITNHQNAKLQWIQLHPPKK